MVPVSDLLSVEQYVLGGMGVLLCSICLFPAAQKVKNRPSVCDTQIQSLSWEDLLKKGMAIPSSILAWRIPWTEEPGRLQFMGSQRVRHD